MKKKFAMLCMLILCMHNLFAQSGFRVEGRVLDANRESLPGVSVKLEGTNVGTVTGNNGNFILNNVPSGSQEITFSYVGFETQTLRIESGAGIAPLEILMQEKGLALEGVTVTAQRREQAIIDVPVAVSSLEGKFFSDLNIREVDALSEYVPGLQVQLQSPNNPGFVIRGITSDNGDSRIEPRVSVFQDGVSISKSRGSVIEVFDMERVEVLKGPQGTLFGRGAQIGAVHFVQNKPTAKLGGELTLGYGNFNQTLASGYINVPVNDKLFIRFAGQYNSRDGFIENEAGGNLNGKETSAGRLSFRWLPSTKTTVDLITNYQYDNYPGTSFQSGTIAPPGQSPNAFTAANLERGEDLFIDRKVYGSTLLVEHDFNKSWRLNSITAFRTFDSYESFDADGTSLPALWFAEEAFGQQFSQEIRMTYDGGRRFAGFLGASYFWEDGYQRVPFETNENSFVALLSPILNAATGGQFPILPLYNQDGTPFLGAGQLLGAPLKDFHREAFANYGNIQALEVFADGTLKVTDQLNLTAGLRGTYEIVQNGFETEYFDVPSVAGTVLNSVFGGSPNLLFAPTFGRVEGEGRFLSWVGRFVANYKTSDNTNFYASVARGRRPNVVQVTASGANTLNEEIVYSFETGAKWLAFNNRLQGDVAFFTYDYRNFQSSVVEIRDGSVQNFVRDAGFARANGFETSLRTALSKQISFFGTYAFIDARFNDTDREGNEQILAGNRFRLTPMHSFSMGFNAEFEIGKGTLFIRPSYTFKSQVFFEEENQDGIEQEAYGLLNARMGYQFAKNKYEVALFGTNLLDEQYLIDAGNTGLAFGTPTFIAGPPRFFGLQVRARF